MTTTYQVRSGDSLGAIARFHGISLKELLALNDQLDKPDLILPGQALNVPEVEEAGPSIHAELADGEGPPWFRIAVREMETGVAEDSRPGRDNPRILEYHQATSLKASDDETPWCSSFVNWCMMKAGVPRTNSAMARSWLKWGVGLDQPRLGCVVVFSRPPAPTSGHVAFFEEARGNTVIVLGGNQSNQINVSAYSKDRLLGYRWLDGG